MEKKINLIICTYAGKYYKFDKNDSISKDRERYLKYNLLFINNNINNLSQITIMKPKINKEHDEINDYYNFDYLNINNIKDKIKIYECENIGISYGQFFTALFKERDFDYHIFIKDDYFPFVDNFDNHLTNMLNSFENETYLCSFAINKKTNFFKKNRIDKTESQESVNKVLEYFNKHKYFKHDIILPDFSLGIICKKGVNKLIKKFNTIDEILELYKIKFNKNWVYKVLFGYTLNIAKISIKDYNDVYLNIFYESSENKLYLCNVGDEYYKNWDNIEIKDHSKKYKLPLFFPIDAFYPNNYLKDLNKIQQFSQNYKDFHNFYKLYDLLKVNYTEDKIENKKICIYISKSHSDYLPFALYAQSIFNILTKNISNKVIITFFVSDIVKINPQVLFVFSINLDDVINCFYPQQIKFIINTENYKTWQLINKLNKLNLRYNVNILEYNPLNVNFIKQHYENINVLFLPQLYSTKLTNYYNKFIENKKISYSNKDIDILFYGNEDTTRRKNIFDILINKFNVKIIHKVNDDILFNFIERSKIVINIFNSEDNKPFDYYRNTFLLANKILLVSEYPRDIDLSLEPYFCNIKDHLIVPEYDDIISCIENILNNYNNHDYIDLLIKKQFDFISQLDMEHFMLKNLKNLIK